MRTKTMRFWIDTSIHWRLGLAALAGMLFLAAVQANATVIFDNDPPDLGNAAFSEFGHPQQMADNFTLLPGANTIGDIHWWGAYNDAPTPGVPANPDNFSIRIFTDAGGLPDSLSLMTVFSGEAMRNATGDQIFGYDIYEYWVDIDPVTLVAGTTYWLSIVNDSLNNGGDSWGWATSDASAGNSAIRTSDGDPWVDFDFGPSADAGLDLAFNLTAPIPEPSGLLLFSVGMLVVGGTLRRRTGFLNS